MLSCLVFCWCGQRGATRRPRVVDALRRLLSVPRQTQRGFFTATGYNRNWPQRSRGLGKEFRPYSLLTFKEFCLLDSLLNRLEGFQRLLLEPDEPVFQFLKNVHIAEGDQDFLNRFRNLRVKTAPGDPGHSDDLISVKDPDIFAHDSLLGDT